MVGGINMEKRILGRTNFQVSVIGFGGIPIQKWTRNSCEMIKKELGSILSIQQEAMQQVKTNRMGWSTVERKILF